MPRIVADSDEEDDDLLTNDLRKENPRPAQSENGKTAPAKNAVETFDGTIEKSTGSRERLERDLTTAELGLVTNSASRKMNAETASSMSPSMRATQRRHTSALKPAASPEDRVRRRTTLKTYGTKRQSQVLDDGDFERLKDDSAAAPATSQSAKFSEHSSVSSSALSPGGSIQDEFLNHEQNVMFRDSGSTVADDSSAQHRLFEQAMGKKNACSTAVVNAVETNEHQSSSIAWSASQRTDADKSSGKQVATTTEVADVTDSHSNENNIAVERFTESQEEQIVGVVTQPGRTTVPRTGAQSPIVEITVEENVTKAQGTPASTRKASSGRKRKADDEETEQLNSDDRAIGLPKEQYKPRPSKRRATQMVDEPIDYSVKPEKAATVKRTRTASAASRAASTQSKIRETSASTDDASVVSEMTAKEDKGDRISTADARPTEIDLHRTDPQDNESLPKQVEQAETPSTQDKVTTPLIEQNDGDHVFVKPPRPTPKTKSTSKTKRAHTTIFEDHVDFSGSQRSPNLSQQQANRKSALQDVKNEAKSTRRKRNAVVPDDEDDEEDELATGSSKVKSPPKKRGRGRPPKSTAKAPEKSVETILDDSDDNDDEPVKEDNVSKNVRDSLSKGQKSTPGLDHATEQSSARAIDGNAEDCPPEDTGENAPLVEPAPSKTPAPQSDKATPQKEVKASPKLHSPIKRSAKVAYRVGLSRRQSIPPLLRNMSSVKR